ncbi:hypothetical protein CDN99_03125 [Roseateles aquatilis]|uniref:DUF4160 domain-containing protein n=1 Tax=Roseateles aquatilis TaxID=431061 RepID=A0A246JLQ9_9BURK|nr:DUF4160 domain-containing protein [Roseateles aquatilis]OWQ93480.1 hypothetical protein CDN99_03125 [Roseateles aquatilis]
MPTIVRLQRSRIDIYGRDHPPPHFHVRANDGSKAAIAIEDLRVLAGEISPPALTEVRCWAEAHRPLLMRIWKERNS